MNTEAILRPKDESSPPPEPQLRASDIAKVWEKVDSTQLADIWGESDWAGSHLTGDALIKDDLRPIGRRMDHVKRISSTSTVLW